MFFLRLFKKYYLPYCNLTQWNIQWKPVNTFTNAKKNGCNLTGDRIYRNNEVAVRLSSSVLHLYLPWLKTWLSMVASTVKNGNNRLRQRNRRCHPWIWRTSNEWIDLVVWLFVYYSIVGFEAILICYCDVWQLWNQCPSKITFLFRPFFTHLWALITEVYLLDNSFIRKTKLGQAIQTVFLPSGLREFLREGRHLTVATGFAVACVTRVTRTSKRTCGIRARSWRMAIMGTCCAFVYVCQKE